MNIAKYNCQKIAQVGAHTQVTEYILQHECIVFHVQCNMNAAYIAIAICSRIQLIRYSDHWTHHNSSAMQSTTLKAAWDFPYFPFCYLTNIDLTLCKVCNILRVKKNKLNQPEKWKICLVKINFFRKFWFAFFESSNVLCIYLTSNLKKGVC